MSKPAEQEMSNRELDTPLEADNPPGTERPIRAIAAETLPPPAPAPSEGQQTQTAVKISFPPGRMLFTALITPEWHHVRKIRVQLTTLLQELSASRDFSERSAMSTGELLENAVKYSVPGAMVLLSVDLAIAALGIEIIVENESTPEHIDELRRILDQVNAGPAFESYLLLLREAASKEGVSSQIGLGRVRTEGYTRIDYQVEGNKVRLRVVPVKTIQEEAETAIIYGRRSSDLPSRRKAQFFVTVFHWLTVVFLLTNLATGLRISWGTEISLLGGMSARWLDWAPQGRTVVWHIWGAWALCAVCIGYVTYMQRTGESRRVRVTRADWQDIGEALRKRNFWRNKYSLWAANVVTYWVGYLVILLLFGTGSALYLLDLGATTLFGGYTISRLIHGVLAYGIIPYAIWHTFLEWRFGFFWSIFKAGIYRKRMRAGALGTAVAFAVVAGVWWLNGLTEKLHVARLPATAVAPVLDGDGEDAAWENAREVSVTTVKGLNFPNSKVKIRVKAIHDGNRIWFRFKWKDPTQSLKRYPLQKTETGWKVVGPRFDKNDEMVWYEDKLSTYLSSVPRGTCEDSCHLGRFAAGQEKPVTWGLHFTEDGSVADVWHWKAVRSNAMGDPKGEPGFMDDMFFGPPVKPEYVKDKRFSAGYYADPQPAGGYKYNHKKADPDKPLSETTVVPTFLPAKLLTIGDGTDPWTGDKGTWWIHDGQGIPYDPAKDDLPVGTMIPNMIISPFQGDRADVRAKGAWKDGEWTLEASRVLDTGTQYDVAFRMDRPAYLSVAAYQQVQTRHSEHYEALEVVLDP